tara:strand:+ start:396 stop:713 length:318 start_codon:yes stop_codon:yes gene_type:complete
MKKTPLDLKKLCTPSFIYFLVSVLSFVLIMIQNLGNTNTFCVGSYSCDVISTFFALVIQAGYILFWTWILDLMCKAGYGEIAWFVLLLPIILFFIIFGILVLYQN